MERLLIVLLMVVFVTGCGTKKEAKKVEKKRDFVSLGMMYLQKKDIQHAIMSFDQAIKMDPNNPENYMTLGTRIFKFKKS